MTSMCGNPEVVTDESFWTRGVTAAREIRLDSFASDVSQCLADRQARPRDR
jgi:hypothetical protein